MPNTKDIKKNVKIFPLYKTLSWDLLFYYSIIYLFLVQEKNITASQVLLADAVYKFASFIFQIPAGRLVSRLGKRNSVIFGNICVAIFSFGLIFINEFKQYLLIDILCAFGYVIKGICETNILYDSLPNHKTLKGWLYSRVDGLGLSSYYYVDAITAILSGFLYVINPYIPIILCSVFCLFAVILSFDFKHTSINKRDIPTISEYTKDIRGAFKHLKKSKRFKSLILFSSISAALFYVLISLRSSFLEEIHLPEQYFGIVFCIFQILAATFSKKSDKIHNKFKNRTLAILSLPVSISCIIIGFLGNTNISIVVLVIIILLFCVQNSAKGPYNNLILRYVNNFTNSRIRLKIHTIKNLFYDLTTVVFSLICSLILNITSVTNTLIFMGCVFTLILVLLLDYMRDKIGLEPKSYDKYDLKYDNTEKEIEIIK